MRKKILGEIGEARGNFYYDMLKELGIWIWNNPHKLGGIGVIIGGIITFVKSIPIHDWVGGTIILLGLVALTVPHLIKRRQASCSGVPTKTLESASPDLYDKCVFEYRRGKLPVEAIINAGACEACETNEDLIRLCDHLNRNGFAHPFEGKSISAFPKADWLKVLKMLKRTNLDFSSETAFSKSLLKVALWADDRDLRPIEKRDAIDAMWDVGAEIIRDWKHDGLVRSSDALEQIHAFAKRHLTTSQNDKLRLPTQAPGDFIRAKMLGGLEIQEPSGELTDLFLTLEALRAIRDSIRD